MRKCGGWNATRNEPCGRPAKWRGDWASDLGLAQRRTTFFCGVHATTRMACEGWTFTPVMEEGVESDVERVGFFYFTPTGHKVQCSVCGAQGWGPPMAPANRHEVRLLHASPWQIRCLRFGHAPCAAGCGKMLVCKPDGSPQRHRRCPTPK